ncbi:MAG: hypothetical protein AB4058_12570 [Microcystaceae cyanobacterium]
MSYLCHADKVFFNTLMSDDDFYPWNPYDEQTDAFLSEQEKNWDFTQDLTDSDVEERSSHLFAHFNSITSY